MSWLNRFRKNDSAVLRLSNKIFEKSLLCADALRPNLEDKFGKGTKEFQSTYFPVLCEFMYFFLHLTDRFAFAQLDHEKRNKLIDEVAPSTIDVTIQTHFDRWPQERKDGMRRDLYNKFTYAQMEYGGCKEVLLKPEEDTRTLEKLISGAKSKSMVGQLTDNLSQVIEGKINTNAFFGLQIWGVIVESLKKKEIHALISEASKEMDRNCNTARNA